MRNSNKFSVTLIRLFNKMIKHWLKVLKKMNQTRMNSSRRRSSLNCFRKRSKCHDQAHYRILLLKRMMLIRLIFMILIQLKNPNKRKTKSQLKAHGYSNLIVILKKRSKSTSCKSNNKRKRLKFSLTEVLLRIQIMILNKLKMIKRNQIRLMMANQQRKCTNVDH